jgi:hypothetical protein
MRPGWNRLRRWRGKMSEEERRKLVRGVENLGVWRILENSKELLARYR